jgi:hypothetical protein
METAHKPTWIARCVKRLAELQPDLPLSLAKRVAERLWEDVRGHVPPEEWAEIEVRSWARQGP